jgi:hypothetical protein
MFMIAEVTSRAGKSVAGFYFQLASRQAHKVCASYQIPSQLSRWNVSDHQCSLCRLDRIGHLILVEVRLPPRSISIAD